MTFKPFQAIKEKDQETKGDQVFLASCPTHLPFKGGNATRPQRGGMNSNMGAAPFQGSMPLPLEMMTRGMMPG